ncbi:MAG: response regulator receiver protein [Micrococcaceae bacterium]|jgi:GAF domain-containing protein|nr:response regulator receiver protein [Micrococcaceae bacterium]
MDEMQYSFGDGPCLTAARTLELVYVRDTRTHERWPQYFVAVTEHGMLSILGVPIPLEGEADCGLNLYSSAADGFTPEAARAVEVFAREASRSLRLAVRIARLSDQAAHLTSALESRTVINLAAGIVMGQNRCGQTTAMSILRAASNSRNMKLRDIAASY